MVSAGERLRRGHGTAGISKHSAAARILLGVNLQRSSRIAYLVLILLGAVTFTLAGPTTSPRTSTRPATQASATSQPATTQLSEKDKRRKINDLMRRSINLLNRKKYAEAEAVLNQALALDPNEATNLYNMAC